LALGFGQSESPSRVLDDPTLLAIAGLVKARLAFMQDFDVLLVVTVRLLWIDPFASVDEVVVKFLVWPQVQMRWW